jgi:outer membrane protein assembly factor BamB/tRNA A-37 threonylcarbamoyl transferase component Bud32
MAGTPSPDRNPLLPGEVLRDRYRILGVLGMGWTGNVYQAQDLNFPKVTRLCAVKEMVNTATDPAVRETILRNFEREVYILATLRHPAVPQIYDYFSLGDRAYLVMEFIQGKDLEAILNSTDKVLPVEQVREWALEICDVLAYLHNHKPEPIIFRDMKPSNVMIDHMNHVRLVDFGIAKIFEVGKKGTMIGTEGYSPPEQYRGEASPQSDIYALGATLHHLLTRRDPRLEPPFSFKERPVREINPDVSEELASSIERALAYKPEDRFSNIEAMKGALGALDSDWQPAFSGASYDHGLGPGKPLAKERESASARASGGVPEVWAFEVGDEIRSSPLVVEGIVYFGAYDNNLWALDAKQGRPIWKYATGGGIASSPAYAQGLIFIGSGDCHLHAVEAASGSARWTFKTGGRIYSNPRPAAGQVFFGADDATFYAVRASNGLLDWRTTGVRARIRSSPAITSERIYFGSESGGLYALSLSGDILWLFQARRAITSSPLVRDNVVYFGSQDSTMYAIDAENGALIWRFRSDKAVVSSPAFYGGAIYFGSADEHVYAVDALSGLEKWRFRTQGQVSSSPLIYQGAVYIGSLDGSLYCLAAATGDLLWQFRSGGPILSSPAAAAGLVYIGSTDHRLYALQA